MGMRMIAALLMIAAAGAVAAEAPSSATTARISAPWKISGVGLGMTPAEVAAALKQDGYRLSHRYSGRSWQGEVANQVLNLRSVRIPAGAAVTAKEEYRVGQEQIQVTYTPGKAGPYVSRVHYKIHSTAIEAESFRRAVLARYGQPSLKWDFESLYCSAVSRVARALALW
jgi:hypothetical protein